MGRMGRQGKVTSTKDLPSSGMEWYSSCVAMEALPVAVDSPLRVRGGDATTVPEMLDDADDILAFRLLFGLDFVMMAVKMLMVRSTRAGYKKLSKLGY